MYRCKKIDKNMNFEFIEIKPFDLTKEKKRINKNFKGELNIKLHKIVDLFCEGKFQECLDIINSLGYDNKEECDEKEYLCMFIADSIMELCDKPNLRIKRIDEKV